MRAGIRSGSNGGVSTENRDVAPSAPAAGRFPWLSRRRPFRRFSEPGRRPALDGRRHVDDYVSTESDRLTFSFAALRPLTGPSFAELRESGVAPFATPPA